MGVSKVLKSKRSAIILEDDLLVSKYFISFMNEALIYYKDNTKIWSISGYSPFLFSLKIYHDDVFFLEEPHLGGGPHGAIDGNRLIGILHN